MNWQDYDDKISGRAVRHSVIKELTIRIASADVIKNEWSHGEVKKPETINYRTLRPEKGGLFCEKIFGPVKDWECACGKYTKIKHRGIVCDRCGVEVTLSKVRRERMAHIDFAVPIVHIGFFRSVPSKIGSLLGLSVSDIEKVTYYEQYIVTDPKNTELAKKQLLTISQYRELIDRFGKDAFDAKMGGEAIRDLLISEDLIALEELLKAKTRKARSMQLRVKLAKRLKVVETFLKSGNKAESMVLTSIPVIPPDLRPLLALDGGRFATSDLNDLQKRLLHRNCRLKTIARMKTPEVIYRSEMRLLQESVDAYYDNGRRSSPIVGSGGRPLKSLAESLRGKQGRFRQNLLGKRVDFSARSVIVTGPELKLNQCGLPKVMALQLFEPFIIRKLQAMDAAYTVKAAKRMIQNQAKEVWDVLEEVTKNHPVVLNRAPTLHRLGLQGFYPLLVEGKAIHLHPLVCSSYNADFDGDQMAVYVPLSVEAQAEVALLMMASDNIFLPSSGKPTSVPTKDMTLGIYYLTSGPFYDPAEFGKPYKIFASEQEVVTALEAARYDDWDLPWDYKKAGQIENLGRGLFIHETIKVRINGQILSTTPGRVIFNLMLPEELRFYNKPIAQKDLEGIVIRCHKVLGLERTAMLLDELKKEGFSEATTCAMSISMQDIVGYPGKQDVLRDTERQISDIEEQHTNGVITDGERESQEIAIWSEANNRISSGLFKVLANVKDGKQNPLFAMLDSGARGNQGQIRQLCGMRGLMARPSGAIVSFAIKSNFREGMSPLEFFIATHGGRKGLADTALRTADSGFLMRRLVDVAQSNVIRESDCGTPDGCAISKIGHGQTSELLSLEKRIIGRFFAKDVCCDGNVIARAGELCSDEVAKKIVEAGVTEVVIRSALTCASVHGVCQKCYGVDLSTGRVVCVGTPVGVIAAQSIGEPGTQLTMRTFHTGGIASASLEPSVVADKTGVVIFDNIESADPTGEGHHGISISVNGKIHFVSEGMNDDPDVILERIKDKSLTPDWSVDVDIGVKILVKHGQIVSAGEKLLETDIHSALIVCTNNGRVKYQDIIEGISVEKASKKTGGDHLVVKQKREDIYPQMVILDESDNAVKSTNYLPDGAVISVQDGEVVSRGTILARIPRSAMKTTDITGGLFRVVELFEARRPKDMAEIAKISGVVSFGGVRKGKRVIIVQDETTGMGAESLIPVGSHIIVHSGSVVKEGQQLTSGVVSTNELLEVCGVEAARRYLLDQVQTIYKLQGVDIDDKHIEMIIRSMMQKVRIVDPGDVASFLYGEEVSMRAFANANAEVVNEGGRPAKAMPLLLGITQAALSTDSPISGASFQSASSVVYNAAFSGSKDEFIGCKENVIVANLIPAGTGFRGKIRKDAIEPVDASVFADDLYWAEQLELLESKANEISARCCGG